MELETKLARLEAEIKGNAALSSALQALPAVNMAVTDANAGAAGAAGAAAVATFRNSVSLVAGPADMAQPADAGSTAGSTVATASPKKAPAPMVGTPPAASADNVCVRLHP